MLRSVELPSDLIGESELLSLPSCCSWTSSQVRCGVADPSQHQVRCMRCCLMRQLPAWLGALRHTQTAFVDQVLVDFLVLRAMIEAAMFLRMVITPSSKWGVYFFAQKPPSDSHFATKESRRASSLGTFLEVHPFTLLVKAHSFFRLIWRNPAMIL